MLTTFCVGQRLLRPLHRSIPPTLQLLPILYDLDIVQRLESGNVVISEDNMNGVDDDVVLHSNVSFFRAHFDLVLTLQMTLSDLIGTLR